MSVEENEKLVEDWLSFARENLLFAKSGMNQDFSPYHTICFLCQGSAEKYLKAYLIKNEWQLEKTHDLSRLLSFCVEFDNSFQSLFPSCELLNEYITVGRYPADTPFESFTEEDARDAVEAAEGIEEFILLKINIATDQNEPSESG